jgi:hypothetical protein
MELFISLFRMKIFFLYSIGVWSQGPALARQTLYHLSQTPSPLAVFQIRFCIAAQANLDDKPPIYIAPM